MSTLDVHRLDIDRMLFSELSADEGQIIQSHGGIIVQKVTDIVAIDDEEHALIGIITDGSKYFKCFIGRRCEVRRRNDDQTIVDVNPID